MNPRSPPDPMVLLEPKRMGEAKQTQDHPDSASMFERVHGEYMQRPAKRLKYNANTHDENKQEIDSSDDRNDLVEVRQSKPKQQPRIVAGGGEISSALKKSNDALPSAPREEVDLTAEDDSEEDEGQDEEFDLKVDDESIEVCLGRIEKAQVSAHKVPTPKAASMFQNSQKHWMAMACTLYRLPGANDYAIHVKDPIGKDFGHVDAHTSQALASLMSGGKETALRLQARLDARPKKPYEFPGQAASDRYPISINVYAKKKYVIGIGRYLSQRQVWLRDPLAVDRNTPICNPHSPKNFDPQGIPNGARQGRPSGGHVAARTVEQVRQDVSKVFDTLQSATELPEMDPPSSVTTSMLPHQKQALRFLYKRERLSIPTVMHSADNKEIVVLDDDEEESETMQGKSLASHSKEIDIWQKTDVPGKGVVWRNAITGHQTRHEPNPLYGGILADVMGLGKTLNILSLIVGSLSEAEHWASQIPEDGIDAISFAKGTLLVCPLSTIVNWKEQIETHLKENTITFYLYQGSSRTNDPEVLRKYDLVITTYQTVGNEWHKTSRNRPEKPLFDNNWFRIVLDEAHQIRNPASGQSKAACELQGQRRWCVTGTPVQNRLEDLATLIRFLRIEPFHQSGLFMKHISAPLRNGDQDAIKKLRILVDLITLRRLKDKLHLPDRKEQIVRLTMSESERNLYEQFQRDTKSKFDAMTGLKKRLGGKSYAQVLKAVGRLRMICAHGADMLSDEDWEFAQGFDPSNAIDLEDEDDSRPDKTPPQAFEMYRLMKDANVAYCAKCNVVIEPSPIEDLEEDEDETFGFLTPCNQLFCKSCIKSWEEDMRPRVGPDNRGVCTICDTYIRLTHFELKLRAFADDTDTQARVQKSKFARNLARYGGPHTKTRHLLDALERNREWSETHPDQLPIKTVVFSEWTTHLDLIQLAFTNFKVPHTRLDGTMTFSQRTKNLRLFDSSTDVNVILVSLKAGGLGLNLTAASKVFVMEPNYNPAAEQQAIERVHRLGQTRDVEIVRYIMADSIEVKVLGLQEKKKKLAAFSVERDGEMLTSREKSEKTLQDIKDLLR